LPAHGENASIKAADSHSACAVAGGDMASSKKTGLRSGHVRKYRQVIEALRKAFGERFMAAVLFGSHARGSARPGSDHDLFVVIRDVPEDRLRRQWLVRETLLPILDRLPGPIAFVIKTPEEVDANLTPLLLDICEEGICLYGEEFFAPYRRKALEAVRQSGLIRTQIGDTLMWVFPNFRYRDWELTWEGFRELPR